MSVPRPGDQGAHCFNVAAAIANARAFTAVVLAILKGAGEVAHAASPTRSLRGSAAELLFGRRTITGPPQGTRSPPLIRFGFFGFSNQKRGTKFHAAACVILRATGCVERCRHLVCRNHKIAR